MFRPPAFVSQKPSLINHTSARRAPTIIQRFSGRRISPLFSFGFSGRIKEAQRNLFLSGPLIKKLAYIRLVHVFKTITGFEVRLETTGDPGEDYPAASSKSLPRLFCIETSSFDKVERKQRSSFSFISEFIF